MVALIDEGHVAAEGRHGGSSGIAHVGHPDAHVLHIIIIGAVAEPAQAGHRGGGHTGLGQFAGSVELRAQAIIIKVVHREVTRGAGAGGVADEGLERLSRRTAANAGALVIVVGHRAAFAVEVLSVEGHLAVFAVGNLGVQHHVLGKHEFVDSVQTVGDVVRIIRERHVVVVVQSHVVSLSGDLHEGERGGFFAGQLPNIGRASVVRLGVDVPNGSRAAITIKGHHLPISVGGGAGGQLHVDVLVAANGHGEFGSHEGEIVLRRPVEVVDCRGGAGVADLEGERFHPAAVRAGANVDGVDDFFILHSEDDLLRASVASGGDGQLSIRKRSVPSRSGRRIVRVWVGSVVVIGHAAVSLASGVVPIAAAP